MAAPESFKDSLAYAEAAPESFKDSLAYAGAAPESFKDSLAYAGAAPEGRPYNFSPRGSASLLVELSSCVQVVEVQNSIEHQEVTPLGLASPDRIV